LFLLLENRGMETLSNLECFAKAAALGSFSGAARQLGLTPSAVSRNVAMLERNLSVRLFHRTTRKLTLTEAGELLATSIRSSLNGLHDAIAEVSNQHQEPSGVLKVSIATVFGLDYVLPLLPVFLARHPKIRIDWQLDNRHVDLISEGYDAAIGRGAELTPGTVSKTLAQVRIIAVASPAYIQGRPAPQSLQDLASHDLIDMRSARTGRIVQWVFSDDQGNEAASPVGERMAFNDPGALCRAAALGLGIAFVPSSHALPYLDRGELLRLLPAWHAEGGPVSIYYANRQFLPAKTRAFVDYVAESFRSRKLAERF